MPAETRNERIAGAFAFRQIYNVLNEFCAAASPATPQEIGGKVYTYLKQFTDDVSRRVDELCLDNLDKAPEDLKIELRRKSIAHMNGIYAQSSPLVNLDERENQFFRQLAIIHDMMSGILSGKISYEVKGAEKTPEPPHPTQTPDGPL